jgi:hypothetical protein
MSMNYDFREVAHFPSIKASIEVIHDQEGISWLAAQYSNPSRKSKTYINMNEKHEKEEAKLEEEHQGKQAGKMEFVEETQYSNFARES